MATTSAGLAFSLGRRDAAQNVSPDETLLNARAIVDAVPLPVSVDLENGFGHNPQDAAEAVRRAASVGAVGGSIEDASGDPLRPIYDLTLAVERVAAAVEAARALPFPFILTARAENFLYGHSNLEDTLRRLQKFQAVGADVLYAPGLSGIDAIRTVCTAVSKPVNVLAGPGYTVAELLGAGAKRISLGSGLNRVALGAFLRAAEEISTAGSFDCLKEAIPYSVLNERI